MTAYVSVTDVRTNEQGTRFLQIFQDAGGYGLGYRLGIGVMSSYKTLNGLPSKYADAFPRPEELRDIFLNDRHALNTLHYADYEGLEFSRMLERIVELCSPHLDAIQLDMTWPDARTLANFHWQHPSIKLILQIGQRALDLVGAEPGQMLTKLHTYRGTVSHVLIDGSMGTGKPLNATVCRKLLEPIHATFPELSLVVAGGLGPESMDLLDPLLADFPGLSFDAQAKLRPSASALDPLDEGYVERYLQRSVAKLRTFTAHN